MLFRSLGAPLLGQRELMVGHVGWDVSSLEFRLRGLGFAPGRVDGRFDRTTALALRSFQRRYRLVADGIGELLLFPQYPHYAMSSYETAVEHVRATHKAKGYGFSLVFKEPYYNEKGYIRALAESMRPALAGKHDHVLFSYHGVPKRHIRK